MRSMNQRSWLVITQQPGNSKSASSRLSRVSVSRSFVGSSRSTRFPPWRRVRARFSLFLSPPESTPARFCWSVPLKPNALTYARLGISCLPTVM